MAVNRRDFFGLALSSFGYIVGSQLFYGKNVSASIVEKFQSSNALNFLSELPEFDGVFFFSPEQLIPFAEDFGHSVHKIPIGALKPASKEDVQKMAFYCNSRGIKLTMRGTGGAAYGQTQLDDGIIIDSSGLKNIRWLSDTLVELEPGLIWTEVLDFTIQKNRAVPVMPDTLVTSVGGKANVGGIGETSYNLGAITDQIVEYDLILADGKIMTCNQNCNPELYRAGLGSMGQFGLMVRIVMKTIPAPEKVYSRQFKYRGTDYSFLTDLQTIATNESRGAIGGHFVRNADGKTFTYVLDVTAWGEENPAWLDLISAKQSGVTKSWSFYDYCNRNTKTWFDAVASGASRLPHPYMSFFTPYERCKEMSDFLQSIELANFGAGRIMMVPLKKISFGSSAFRLPDSDWIAHVRIYRIARNGENGEDHQRMIHYNQNQIVPMIYDFGGKVYFPFSPLLTKAQLKFHFENESLGVLEKFKKTFDPQKLLNSGAEIL